MSRLNLAPNERTSTDAESPNTSVNVRQYATIPSHASEPSAARGVGAARSVGAPLGSSAASDIARAASRRRPARAMADRTAGRYGLARYWPESTDVL